MLAVLILLIGGATTVLLLAREEEAPSHNIGSTIRSVDTLTVHKGRYRIQVPAWGFVDPCDRIDVRTEIAGRITRVADSVFAGARVIKGAPLFSLDARTYQNALAVARAEVDQARQSLAIEQGHQAIAKAEWHLLEQSQWGGEQNKALALREPQLKECRAKIKIAAARAAQAALDVERTRVRAPCTGVILSETLAAGQILESGDAVLQLACTEHYHITAAFPPRYALDPVATAGASAGATAEGQGKARTVAFQVGGRPYKGMVKAILPQIDPKTRQKQALVSFTGRDVTLGAYVGLHLPGKDFRNVAALPREALRADETVWLLSSGGTLEIRKVAVLAEDPQRVVIGEGLDEGERVILSHLANPLEGLPLRAATSSAERWSQGLAGKGDHP